MIFRWRIWICLDFGGRETLEFLGLWESLHNPDFKPVEFDGFRSEAGSHAFTMSPTKWIESVNAIGIVTKAGCYGGTYAHSDIALEFASWVSAEFKLYIMKDYQRLKQDENSRLSLNWNLNREIAKLNYRIHTNAIKDNLIPPELTPEQIKYTGCCLNICVSCFAVRASIAAVHAENHFFPIIMRK